MANSIKEVKEILGIKSVRAEWNDPFPREQLLSINAGDSSLCDKIKRFYSHLDKHNLSACKVDRRDLCKICQIADVCDLMLAYIVTEPIAIELFFWHKIETSDWLAQFKQHCTRRQFFSLFQTLKNVKPANSDFTLSQFYQLVSPNLPLGYTASTFKLDNNHIIVAYRHDVEKPILRVIEISEDGFKSFEPEVYTNMEVFDSIEIKFNGKTYQGDSLKTLWDGTERGYQDKETISVNYEGCSHILNTVDGTVEFDDGKDGYDFFEIEKFRRGKNVDIILEVDRHNKKALLLSNGFIWVLNDDTFYDIKGFSGLEQINLDLFSMSSKDKGIVVSKDATCIELVPCSIFADIIYRIL